MAPLARAGLLDEDKIVRHSHLVKQLPGILSRVRAFNEFAERMWCAKRKDMTARIVQEQLRPMLERRGF